MAGSMSPLRVPITSPSAGVMPMDVSTHLPSRTAATLHPLPKWQVTTRLLARPRSSKNRRALPDTNLCEVPWNP